MRVALTGSSDTTPRHVYLRHEWSVAGALPRVRGQAAVSLEGADRTAHRLRDGNWLGTESSGGEGRRRSRIGGCHDAGGAWEHRRLEDACAAQPSTPQSPVTMEGGWGGVGRATAPPNESPNRPSPTPFTYRFPVEGWGWVGGPPVAGSARVWPQEARHRAT